MKSFWETYWNIAKPNGKDKNFTIERIKADDLDNAVHGDGGWSFAAAVVMGPTHEELKAAWEGEMENVYRVFLDDVGRHIEVVCLGMDKVDSEVEGIYNRTDELPMWMQEKLTLLSMLKVDPPQTKVEGVGMRVDEKIFWVIKGE